MYRRPGRGRSLPDRRPKRRVRALDVVVVESPAKARTIEKYLGRDFTVLATYGHVCDLPAKDGSVRPDEDFAMDYATDPRSAKHLKAIAEAARGAGRLLLATDPDREGEAISWHVKNHLLGRRGLGDVDIRRIVFHEVTREAVGEAVRHPRDIDMDLVNAQQARRALDYLVGFTLSPVLWRKVPGSRSAGRVQSVALRLVVDREMEIEAHRPREYWTVAAKLTTPAGRTLTARLVSLDGKRLEKFDLADEAAARGAAAAVEARTFSVARVERKQARRSPPPPFTTSTLQQEASRKLGFRAEHTMRVAQRLYEGVDIGGETMGLITYMRTDAVTLSNEAVAATRRAIERRWGADYLPGTPRRYRTKARNAQEAHEAIRPTDPARRPADLRLGTDEKRLYDLIWRRTVACQMADARLDQVRIDFAAPDGGAGLRASGSTVAFDGFLAVYAEGRDDAADDEDEERRLPKVEQGDAMTLGAVDPAQHFTEPPPRYTEASLVRRMEELGIGRPSTYAGIVSVLQDRGYVKLERKRFLPEDRGRLVTAFLANFFETYVRYDFTARLEDQLDQISNGDVEWKSVLSAFWSGFSAAVEDIGGLGVRQILDTLDEALAPHIFPESEDGDADANPRACPKCGDGRLGLKLGRYGAFVGCSNYPECRYTRQLAASGGNGAAATDDGPRTLGQDANGTDVTVRKGPYGHYVQLGEAADDAKPKRTSVPKGTDAATIELPTALALLDLPRDIGAHPETGKTISAGIGRYGPYLRHDGAYKSLGAGDDVLTVGLNRAVILLAAPARGRGRAPAVPLKVLGTHPDDGVEVAVFEGRYGPYARHGAVMASLPRGADPDSVTLERMLPLLAEKAAKGTKGKGGRKPRAAAGSRQAAGAAKTKKPAKKKASRAKRAPAPGRKSGGGDA